MYTTLRLVHITMAVVSIAGFMLRGVWMLLQSALLDKRLTRIAPHVIDSVFLLSGIGLVVTLHLPVLKSPWLLAKFAGLIVYIVLGAMALRRGRPLRARAIAFGLALIAYAYIVGAALSKSAYSWLAYG